MDIKNLDSVDFITANNKILEFIKSSDVISDSDILLILELEERELTSTFLEEYEGFTTTQLNEIEKYVNQHISDEDKDYVSDLIDFSKKWGLKIDYNKMLPLLSDNSEENHFVVLSSVLYIQGYFNYFFFDEVITSLMRILNDSNHYQNVQILSAICLFRHTHNVKYLKEIEGWMDNEFNTEFVLNVLGSKDYRDECFSKESKDLILKILKK